MDTRTAPRTPSTPADITATTRADGKNESLPSLAEVLDRVASHGPQIITRGDDRFVVLEAQEIEIKEEEPDFIQFLLNGPRFDGVLIERDPDIGRDIEL